VKYVVIRYVATPVGARGGLRYRLRYTCYSVKAGGVMRLLRFIIRSVCRSVSRITHERVDERRPNMAGMGRQEVTIEA